MSVRKNIKLSHEKTCFLRYFVQNFLAHRLVSFLHQFVRQWSRQNHQKRLFTICYFMSLNRRIKHFGAEVLTCCWRSGRNALIRMESTLINIVWYFFLLGIINYGIFFALLTKLSLRSNISFIIFFQVFFVSLVLY